MRSRSSESIRNSTIGSTSGSSERNRTSPWENTRMTAPNNRPPASASSSGPTAENQIICMSFGPASARPDVYRSIELNAGASGDGIRDAGFSAISKPAVAAWSLRFAPTGRPSPTPTPDRRRIAGE